MEIEGDKMRDTQEVLGSLSASLDRLAAASAQMEKTVVWLEERHAAISGEVHHVIAAIETPVEVLSQRETELERRLEAAESQIVELRSQAHRPAPPARKTLPSLANTLLAKQGINSVDSIEAGTLDAALAGLSLEQRIAVKSQLMKAGALA